MHACGRRESGIYDGEKTCDGRRESTVTRSNYDTFSLLKSNTSLFATAVHSIGLYALLIDLSVWARGQEANEVVKLIMT